MAKNYLRQIEQDARRLRLALRDDDELPGWVNAYVYTSADRLQTASRYMQGRITRSAAKKNPRFGEPVGQATMVAPALAAISILFVFGLAADRLKERESGRRLA